MWTNVTCISSLFQVGGGGGGGGGEAHLLSNEFIIVALHLLLYLSGLTRGTFIIRLIKLHWLV